VEAARQAFPHLKILARAWDRRHAYELLREGADDVERETFEGSLAVGRRALIKLGFSEFRATRAATAFRRIDTQLFKELAPIYGQEENYILASRDSRDTMDKLLGAEMRKAAEEDAERMDLAESRRAPEADKSRDKVSS